MLLTETTWPEIEKLREAVADIRAVTLLAAAGQLADLFVARFSSIVLARVFVVVPFHKLPPVERGYAEACVPNDPRLVENTPVLSLLATRGRESDWNARERSKGHRAIPLLDRAFVQDAPMIAKLLGDLDVDLQALDDGRGIVTRRLLGGRNSMFFVQDAPSARDAGGRPIIPAQDFVAKHAIRTVFGMGGAYLRGELAVMILFCNEDVDRLVADRFPSLISNFKMATAHLVDDDRIYAEP